MMNRTNKAELLNKAHQPVISQDSFKFLVTNIVFFRFVTFLIVKYFHIDDTTVCSHAIRGGYKR